MPNTSPGPPRISIATLRRRPDIPAATSAEALHGLRDGLTAASAAIAVNPTASRRLQLPELSIRAHSGATARDIAEAVHRTVEAAIRERLG
jgi:hypothetical protein